MEHTSHLAAHDAAHFHIALQHGPAQAAQGDLLQLLQRGVLLAHLDKILLLTLGDIARGHVEVLGHQDVAQHVRRQHAGQIGLFIGRIPRLIELLLRVRKLLFRIFQLCFCGTQRHFTLVSSFTAVILPFSSSA